MQNWPVWSNLSHETNSSHGWHICYMIYVDDITQCLINRPEKKEDDRNVGEAGSWKREGLVAEKEAD